MISPSINVSIPAHPQEIEHTFWRPSDILIQILRRLHEEDYAQFPCIPCSYCSRLLYPYQIKWIIRQANYVFPFERKRTQPDYVRAFVNTCNSMGQIGIGGSLKAAFENDFLKSVRKALSGGEKSSAN